MGPLLAWQHVLQQHPVPPHVQATQPSSGPLSTASLWARLLPHCRHGRPPSIACTSASRAMVRIMLPLCRCPLCQELREKCGRPQLLPFQFACSSHTK